MNFELSEDQQLLRENFARYLDENSSMSRVRAAQPSGFDPALWTGLAELGAFSLRVPEEAGGVGLGLLDAAVFMEEVGERWRRARLLKRWSRLGCLRRWLPMPRVRLARTRALRRGGGEHRLSQRRG